MDKKRTWNLAGMMIGIALIIVGIVFMVRSQDSFSTRTEYASFGGNFYTYEYAATRAAANNVGKLGKLMLDAVGISLMAAGALVVIHYGKDVFAAETKDSAEADETPISSEEDLKAQEPKHEGSVWNEIEPQN